MKGRKPKSAEQKRLNGNAGKRAFGVMPVVVLTPSVPEYPPPGDMSFRAQTKWNELIPRLMNLNLLRDTDLEALKMLCNAIADYDAAREHIEEHGRYYKVTSKHGAYERRHPAVDDARTASALAIKIMESLGMTSGSRVRALATGIQSRQLNLPFLDVAQPQAGSTNDGPVGYLHSRAIN